MTRAGAVRRLRGSRKSSLGGLAAIRRLRAQLAEARKTARVYRKNQQLLFSASQSAKAVIDGKMRLLDINASFLRSLGLAKREVLGRSALDFVAERNRSKAAKTLSRAFRGMAEPVETEIIGQRGARTFLFAPGLVPVVTSKGMKGSLISGVDITDRRRAEEALRQSEERLRLIFEHSFDGISIREVDPSTFARRLVYCNDRFVQMSGRSRKELMKTYGVKKLLIHAASPQERTQQRQRLLSGQTCRGVDSWIRPDGKENYHEWVAVPVSVGGKSYIIGIDRDITERRQAEESLRQSQERLRLILEHSSDGINIMELDPASGKRRLVLFNERLVEMTGHTREELTAVDDINVFLQPPSPDVGMAHKDYVRMVLEGKPFRGTGSWMRPDGKVNYIEWTAAPIRMGQKVYVIGIDRDITERRQAEEALHAANRKLMTAREEERQYLARELHDSLGQGLVGLQLAIQATIGAAKDGLHPSQTNRLEAAANKCSELIREVRNICHGLYPPTLESLGLAAALRQLAGYCRDAQVETSVHCGPALSNIRLPDVVEIALFRIAQEATSNSLRHGRPNRIEIDLDYADGLARLRIIDDGAGFDAVRVTFLGLGLGTMKERARAVGGEVRIESRPGRTSIEAVVPVAPRSALPAAQAYTGGHPVS